MNAPLLLFWMPVLSTWARCLISEPKEEFCFFELHHLRLRTLIPAIGSILVAGVIVEKAPIVLVGGSHLEIG